MRERFDTIVVGLGGMGSAALYHLAARGQRVLGLERYTIAHAMGSSHGVTRIIRLAYHEHPHYVPLLRRAFVLWRALAAQMGEPLLHITGSVDAGPPGSSVVRGALASCSEHHLAHEVLTASQLSQRAPAFALPAGFCAVWQPDGGFLLPERCTIAHIRLAEAHGAQIRTQEAVRGWDADDSGVAVQTDGGNYRAEQVVLCAGPWMNELVPWLKPIAIPERQVIGWFTPSSPHLFTPDRLPVFVLATDDGARYYGLPIYGVPGFKVGRMHHRGERCDATLVDRAVHPEDEHVLRSMIERYFPRGAGRMVQAQVCMFTNTPDEHFIVDRHPHCERVVLVSACSGHGFKFCSVIGEMVADMVVEGQARQDLSLHRISRFSQSGAIDQPSRP